MARLQHAHAVLASHAELQLAACIPEICLTMHVLPSVQCMECVARDPGGALLLEVAMRKLMSMRCWLSGPVRSRGVVDELAKEKSESA